MTTLNFVFELDKAADAIIALINANPRSPTKAEIRTVLEDLLKSAKPAGQVMTVNITSAGRGGGAPGSGYMVVGGAPDPTISVGDLVVWREKRDLELAKALSVHELPERWGKPTGSGYVVVAGGVVASLGVVLSRWAERFKPAWACPAAKKLPDHPDGPATVHRWAPPPAHWPPGHQHACLDCSREACHPDQHEIAGHANFCVKCGMTGLDMMKQGPSTGDAAGTK